MQDLTTGSITRHLLKTMSFMLTMMVFQTLYVLVDLYWVGRLGTTAVAAVGIAGNLMFTVLALTQMLGVGTTTVVAQAMGRREPDEARLAFNQSLSLAALCGALFLAVALAIRPAYAASQSSDLATAREAARYLRWFIPAMALQFPMVAMTAALRGVGDFKLGVAVGIGTVAMNLVLAPVLIFGWLGAPAMGTSGAAAATLVAIVIANAWLLFHFRRQPVLRVTRAEWWPRMATWRRMLAIGLPSGFDFAMMAVYLFIVYAVTRPFGAAAQAGFGIGMRVVQALFMPVVALGLSVAPIAGQNFGARHADRVRHTFRDAAVMSTALMLLFTLLCHLVPGAMVGVFTRDPAAIAVGSEYLRIVSWNFVASGLIFVAGSMFQAMGNTLPSVVTSLVRIVVVAVPVVLLSRQPGFELVTIWRLAVASVWAQLVVALLLLRREYRRRLAFPVLASLALLAGGCAPSRATVRPLNVGHRGASGHAPEHTIAAYDLALAQGADYIEQDLQLTSDGVLVVLHDATLDRTARGPADRCTGRVRERTLAQLEACDVGAWFNATHPERARPEYVGLRIPTLDAVLARYAGRTRFYIETKQPEDAPGMEAELLRLLDRYALRGASVPPGRVVVQSFSAASLATLHALAPDLPLVRLMPDLGSAVLRDSLDGIARYAAGIGPAKGSVDRALVDAAHARCLVVHPYTVNETAEMRRLLALGVDGMFTNFPDRLSALRPEQVPTRAVAAPAACAARAGLAPASARRSPRSTRANLGIIAAVEGAAFGITWLLPDDISKWDKSRPPSYYLRRSFSRPPVWDRDHLFWNWIVHPVAGQHAYLLERNEGRGPLRSFLVATAASVGWEYGFEAFIERPSAQDLLITSPVGAVLGELSHQATRRLVRGGLRRRERVLLAIINPLFGMRARRE